MSITGQEHLASMIQTSQKIARVQPHKIKHRPDLSIIGHPPMFSDSYYYSLGGSVMYLWKKSNNCTRFPTFALQ